MVHSFGIYKFIAPARIIISPFPSTLAVRSNHSRVGWGISICKASSPLTSCASKPIGWQRSRAIPPFMPSHRRWPLIAGLPKCRKDFTFAQATADNQSRRDVFTAYRICTFVRRHHFPTRLPHKSRCFYRCPHALQYALKLFVFAFNRRQLQKQTFSNYQAHTKKYYYSKCFQWRSDLNCRWKLFVTY